MALQAGSVLEVAAGDAALSACLASKQCSVAANDLRGEHLQAAVGAFTNGHEIRLFPGNLFDLDPSTTGQFDLVIACEVIEHVANTISFLEQLKRFVAPGGRILLTTPNGSYFRNKLPTHSMIKDFKALESQQFKPDADGHLFLITPKEMEDLAGRAGLVVQNMSLWGTPFVTGHVGMSMISAKAAFPIFYGLEHLFQVLPIKIRAKISLSFSVLLSPS
jgi:2-polyprenyl-6-hydroxyphenyl methylase/3-demethylubiquinone-9 3-methyltransferase